MESENREMRRHSSRKGLGGTPLWVTIGAAVLIILLLVWLTIAMFTGDTDVQFIALPGLLG